MSSELQRRVGVSKLPNVAVPDDVRRVDSHEPCFFCGVRAGLPCRHRSLAA
jgi:hypothetical protein